MFALTSAKPLGPFKNAYIIKCMDRFYQTQVFTVCCIFKNSFRTRQTAAEHSPCCSHHAQAGGNTIISKNHLSLMTLLARRVLPQPAFHSRAGFTASHQNHTFWNSSDPVNAVPKSFSEPFAGEEEGKEKEPTALCELFSSA